MVCTMLVVYKLKI